MKPNPFRCPACGLPANNVDGDPFAIDAEHTLLPVKALDIFVACGNGHQWFERATFSAPRIPADWDEPIGAPEVLSRQTSAVVAFGHKSGHSDPEPENTKAPGSDVDPRA